MTNWMAIQVGKRETFSEVDTDKSVPYTVYDGRQKQPLVIPDAHDIDPDGVDWRLNIKLVDRTGCYVDLGSRQPHLKYMEVDPDDEERIKEIDRRLQKEINRLYKKWNLDK